MSYSNTYGTAQASRVGRTAITFFVKDGAKPVIRAALADGGYGTSYQEGIVNLINDLLESQQRSTTEAMNDLRAGSEASPSVKGSSNKVSPEPSTPARAQPVLIA